jgi:mono/diheme cytochrome c family protein
MIGELLRALQATRKFIARLQPVLVFIVAVSAIPKACGGDATELFNKNCALCHSKDGTAQTPAAKKLGVKDLSQSKLTDEQIAEQIRDGKLDKEGSLKMPAFKDKLTPDEVKSLLPVVKGFRK